MPDIFYQWGNRMFRVPDDGSVGAFIGEVRPNFFMSDHDSSAAVRTDGMLIVSAYQPGDGILSLFDADFTMLDDSFGNLSHSSHPFDSPGHLAWGGSDLYLLEQFTNDDFDEASDDFSIIVRVDPATGSRLDSWGVPTFDAENVVNFGFEVVNGDAYYLSGDDGVSLQRATLGAGVVTVFTEMDGLDHFTIDPETGDFWSCVANTIRRRSSDGTLLDTWNISASDVDSALHVFVAPDGMVWYAGNGASDGTLAFSRFQKDGTGIGTRFTHLPQSDTGTANGTQVGFASFRYVNYLDMDAKGASAALSIGDILSFSNMSATGSTASRASADLDALFEPTFWQFDLTNAYGFKESGGTIPVAIEGVGSSAGSASASLVSDTDIEGGVGSSASSASASMDIVPPKVIAAIFYGPTSGVVRWREVIESSGGGLSLGSEQTVSSPASISQIDTYMVDSIGEGYFRFAANDINGNTSIADVSNIQRDDIVNWVDVPFVTKQTRAIDRTGVQGGGPICSSESYEMYSGIVHDGTDTTIDIAYRQRGTNGVWSHMTVPAGAAVLWVGGMTAFPGTDYVLLMYGVGAEYSWNNYGTDGAVATTLRARCVDVSTGSWGTEVTLATAARIGIYSPAANSVVATTSTLACLLYYNSASPFNSYSQSVPLTRSGVELTAGAQKDVSYSTDYVGSWEKAVRVDDQTVLATYVTNNNDFSTSHILTLRYDGTNWNQVQDVSLRGSSDNERVSSVAKLDDGNWLVGAVKEFTNSGVLRKYSVNASGGLTQVESISLSLPFLPNFMKCVARGN